MQRDGDGRQAEETGLDGGGDGAAVDDVDADVGAEVQAADDKIRRARQKIGDGELDADNYLRVPQPSRNE
jgi:hypothetical protein